jgi:hypothetical protein
MPKYVLIKSTGTENWAINDTARSPSNTTNKRLLANTSGAEYQDATEAVDMLSNGFKIRTSDGSRNTNGQTYIYMAFAENPFKYSLAR